MHTKVSCVARSYEKSTPRYHIPEGKNFKTNWQHCHYKADESGTSPVLGLFGGCFHSVVFFLFVLAYGDFLVCDLIYSFSASSKKIIVSRTYN